MRIDKFLKNSRIIKRRTVAKEACDRGRVSINGKVAKAGDEVREGDELGIQFGEEVFKARILKLIENPKKADAPTMWERVD